MVPGRRYVSEWGKWDDGSLMRLVYLPEGTTCPAVDKEPDGESLWPYPEHPGLGRKKLDSHREPRSGWPFPADCCDNHRGRISGG